MQRQARERIIAMEVMKLERRQALEREGEHEEPPRQTSPHGDAHPPDPRTSKHPDGPE